MNKDDFKSPAEVAGKTSFDLERQASKFLRAKGSTWNGGNPRHKKAKSLKRVFRG